MSALSDYGWTINLWLLFFIAAVNTLRNVLLPADLYEITLSFNVMLWQKNLKFVTSLFSIIKYMRYLVHIWRFHFLYICKWSMKMSYCKCQRCLSHHCLNTPRIFQYCHPSCQSALQYDQFEAVIQGSADSCVVIGYSSTAIMNACKMD